jgi:hypothetical protein
MRPLRLLLGVAALTLLASRPTLGAGCVPCQFHGECGAAHVPCTPSEAGCVPNGGILVFNSVRPNVPSYWTLYARRNRPPGTLTGKLKVFADDERPLPVPGGPWRCSRLGCRGRTARFAGTMTGDRLDGVATHRSGASCTFSMTIAWGFGDPTTPNTFTCTNAAGEVTGQGAIDLQGIRLSGCLP